LFPTAHPHPLTFRGETSAGRVPSNAIKEKAEFVEIPNGEGFTLRIYETQIARRQKLNRLFAN
jgi:hypothetical protein